MSTSAIARAVLLALGIAMVAPSTACHRAAGGAGGGDAATLPPLTVRDDTTGVLLTWIDDKGDFHVEQKTADVPLVGRDAVRVVDPTRDEGARGDAIYVADLRVPGADGTYPVHTMSREDFDALAVERRAKSHPTLDTLGSASGADGGAGAPSAPSPGASDVAAAGRPAVIVYGASWCSACHQAEAYFRQHGILFVEHDVEKEPQAAAEMRSKLRRAGLRDGSIPVIDVRGHIMVGFDPRSIESALGSPI
jgi:glutaredoxin